MPQLPAWLVLTVGALVTLFGAYRLRMAFRNPADDAEARERGGLFGHPRRTHGLFGVVYILMGLLLILGALGIRMPWMH